MKKGEAAVRAASISWSSLVAAESVRSGLRE